MITADIYSQLEPIADDIATLYTSVGNIQANIWLATQDYDNISIALIPSGDLLEDKHWVAYDVPVYKNYSFYLQVLCFQTGDVIKIRSRAGTTSFTLTGIQFS